MVLGCTHFPQLLDAIRAVVPAHVRLVDSAATTAQTVRHELQGAATLQWVAGSAAMAQGSVRWLATDGAARFARVGSRFLGQTLQEGQVEIVDL